MKNESIVITAQQQLMLPLAPFLIDLAARWIFLSEKINWYQIPDLVTLFVTTACFCLTLMSRISEYSIDSDKDAQGNATRARNELLFYAILLICSAGLFSTLRAADEMAPQLQLMIRNGLNIFIFSACAIIYIIYRSIRTLSTYAR